MAWKVHRLAGRGQRDSALSTLHSALLRAVRSLFLDRLRVERGEEGVRRGLGPRRRVCSSALVDAGGHGREDERLYPSACPYPDKPW
jgi:hypothetical protein